MTKLLFLAALVLPVAGCNTWTQTNIDRTTKSIPVSEAQVQHVSLSSAPFNPARQEKLADLDVAVNKTTAFHPNPTIEAVEAKLREDAAKLGATAVVDVKISDVKISAFSWGTRTGTGIAVKAK